MVRLKLLGIFLAFIGSTLCLVNEALAQCTITNLNATYCSDDAPVALTSSPGGLSFYRAGVSGSIANYDPSVVIGSDTVVATNGVASSYTVTTAGTFAPIAPAGSTAIPLVDNSQAGPIAMGFTFNFFGNNYNNVYIGTNGLIGFTSGITTGTNQALPNNSNPNNLIALAWDQLNPTPGPIEYFISGRAPFRKFIVSYNVQRDGSAAYVVQTQVQLHETTNIIEIHSTNINISANFATQGIENAGGTVGYTTPGRNDQSWTATNDYVAFIPDCIDIRYVTVTETPNPADAGPATIDQCNNGSFVMSATPANVGSGTWSLISGSATITTPSSPTTTVTGVPLDTSATLRWTVTNGSCSGGFDDVVLTNYANPSTSDAGPPSINQCNNSTFMMSANTPAVGTGTWSVVSGSATITNATSPTTTITAVAAGTSATLRWSVTNGVCAASTDDIVLNNYALPSAAVAGPDQNNCNSGNFTMAATPPGTGSGTWSLISGTATITTPGSASSTVTGVPVGTSATLRWTVTNGSCAANTDDVVLINYANPTTSDAGPPSINQCNNSTFTMSANAPAVGTGTWSVVSGSATITNAASPTTTITAVATGTSATLRWTISNGPCVASTDDVVLTNYALPSAAIAGPDQNNCNSSGFTMAATVPGTGTGTWSLISGTATITTPGSPNTTVTGVPLGTGATLRWTVSNGPCTANTDDVVVTNYANPSTANAGPPTIDQCNNSTFAMSANTPAIGTGLWSVVSGSATITNATSPTTTITAVAVGTSATLRWTISNGPCVASTDDVVLTNYALPSASVAGPDQDNCNNGNFTMAATPPGTGSGTWSLIGGTATITTPGSASSTVTGVPVGSSATLRWTVSNGPCTANTDDVVLTNYANPTTADAGAPAINQCNSGNFTMSANTPAVGTGTWSVVSGSATITNATSPTTTITAVAVGTSATLRWTISNGPCVASTDDIVLTNYALPSAAVAGPDQGNCNDGNFTLAATPPGTGAGAWSLIGGTATITTPGSASSTVTGVPVGSSATLRWTVSNGPCTANTDDVVLTNYANPTTADAGAPAINQCNSGNFTMSANTPAVGTGTWSVVSGSATITNATSPTTTITAVAVGTSATLRWTISNGPCVASTDDIVLTNYALPSAAVAGPDQGNCNDGNFTMAATPPGTGSGTWSLISGTATITTPGSASSTVTGVPVGTSATLRWTVTNGPCAANTDDVVLTNFANPSASDAGPPAIDQCNNNTFAMSANTPAIGSGMWSVVSGSATITNATSPTTTITAVPVGTSATLRWTISNGPCVASTDDIVLTNYALPSAAVAGPDLGNCNSGSFTMAATPPGTGTGTWSVISGSAAVTMPGSASSSVTGVPVGTSATLRWTVTNGPCTVNTDDVVLTNYASPTISDAGPPGIDQCNNSTFTMSANTPVTGTGTWSLVSGSATITNATSPATTITGITAGNSATLRWTISNGPCAPSTDDIVLTNYALPSAAAAGPDQDKCSNGNFTMAATPPATGSGMWSVVSGTATITTPGAANSTVTGVPLGTIATLRWTVSNGPCTTNTDDVVLTNYDNPTPADAGPPTIEQCSTSSFTMSANTPATGTGTWTVVSGSATITNAISPTTTVTGVTAGTSATLRWTITNGPCASSADDVVLTNYDSPSGADAGPDLENCNDGNFTMAATPPGTGTGAWSLVSGTATITSPASPTTTVTGVPVGTSAVLRWTVTGGTCPTNTDDVSLTNHATPTTANAGPPSVDQCNNSTFSMSANTPAVGIGTWSVVSGAATITNATSPTTTITGVAAGSSATLRWTIANGTCAASTDDIVLTNHALPSAAVAGPDQDNCNSGNFTLAATPPATGTGTWSVVSGTATITTPGSANSTVTGVPLGSSAVLRWTVSSGPCTSNTDEVILTNYANPTTANAGPPLIEQCNQSTFTMGANSPAIGTGNWSLVSGAATITNASSPTTTITGVAAGTSATLRWTISNGPCVPSTDDVVLTNYAAPSAAVAGPDLNNCNDGNFTMGATPPGTGTGIWSLISGTATITTPGAVNTTVTGVPVGSSATLRWTVSNGPCTPETDDIVLTNYANPTMADAGPPTIEQCSNGSFTMNANAPAVGTGAWTVVSGTATITNATSPTTTVTGVPSGTSATLRWTISNGPCTPTTDDIVLTNYSAPSSADAGPDQQNCNNGNFTMAATPPVVGTGTWTLVSGAATITDPSLENTAVTGVPVGTSATLRWTVSSGTCPVGDDVVLTNYANPSTADAGPPTIDQCNTSIFVMSANTPAQGTGSWSLVSGSATITNASLPSTTITGIAAGTSATLRWTISNGPCAPSTDDIILTNYAAPSPSDAGPDLENCNSGSFTLGATVPGIGSGTWSVVGGTATITAPASATSAVTGVPVGTSATLRWTVSNGTCSSSTDDVVLTNHANPTSADAGPASIEQCNTSIFVMNANVPAQGTGSWSVVSGTATISNPALATTTITGVAAGTSATLRWTIGNGNCPPSSDDIVLTNYASPSAADAGFDQENCDDGNFTMGATAPAVGTGTWSLVSGTATITTPGSPTTTVTGVTAGTGATLRWTVSNGTCSDNVDDVVLTNYASPTTADAGPPVIEQCNNSTFFMSANIPTNGSGSWIVLSGTANVTNPSSATTTVTGVPAGTVARLRWLISNGPCFPSFDDIDLVNHAAPSVADAGPDLSNCNDGNFTMGATAPITGTGAWSLISGTATITDPASETTTVTGVPVGTSATLRWTVTNGTCNPSIDDVILNNYDLPATADAGPPQIEQCNSSTFLMNANAASPGTGSWSVVSGTATIVNATSPTTTITNVAAGTTAILRWTISNLTCGSTSDDIMLINYAPPTTASAGPDQDKCNDGNFTMAGNAPVTGTGTWILISGAATITTPGDPFTTVTGVPAGTSATLRWSISNGTCSPSEDDVVITNFATPPVADAGPAQIEQCNTGIFTMTANSPAPGIGLWTIVSGVATITNSGSPTTTITNIAAGTSATVRWTVSNGVCGSTSDDIVLINYEQATAANAGPDQTLCASNAVLAANAPTVGMGLWSVVSGAGGVITSPANPASDFSGALGTTYVLRWTITNGLCSSYDDVTIILKPTPDVAASDKSICSGENTNISITNPNGVSGTQFDWVVQSAVNVTGAAGGTGNLINQSLTSTDGVTNGTVVYRITPSANNCTGAYLDVTVTVKPVPVFTNNPEDFFQPLCSGDALNFLPATSIASASVSWTSVISGTIDPSSVMASGSGPITDSPINTGNVSGTVTYHLTPGFNGCSGPSADLVVQVRPLPTATASDRVICSGQTAVINISPAPKNVSGTTFSWTATPSANIAGAADGNGSTISQTLSTTDANIGTVTYSITPAANGCAGVPVNITVTVNPVATVSAGSDFTVCEPSTIPLSGMLGGSATSGTWTIASGAGTISASTVTGSTVTANYTVDPSDIGKIAVFRITTDDPDGAGGPCSIAFDDVNVSINRQPQVMAPADFAVCEPSSIVLTGTLGGSATSGSWTIVSASGTLSVSSVTGNSVTATYLVSNPVDIGAVLTFRLTTNDPDGAGPCTPTFDDVNVTVNESPKVNAGPDDEVCENEIVQLDGSFSGTASSVTWSGGSGAAQFANVNDPKTTYTLTPADVAAGSVTLVLTTDDPDGGGPCTNVSDQVVIRINQLPAVFLSGLQASYAENEPPVAMDGFPPGGTFTGPGVLAGTNIFDPATANIGFNTIVYTYTDPNGCTNSANRTVVVNELTSTDFGVFNGISYDFSPSPEICANIGRAYLKGTPDYTTGYTPTFFSSPDIPARIGLDATGYYIDTDGLLSGRYYVQYTYTNEFNATSVYIKRVTVYASPVAAIDASNACEKSPIQFNDLSTIPNNTLSGTITSWLWDFDDQGLLNSNQNPVYTYQNPAIYDVQLKVTTDQGCVNSTVKQLVIGPPPTVNFNWSGICNSQNTQFTNLSTISGGFSFIDKYQWDFGDGDVTLLDNAANPIPPGTHGGRTNGTYQDPGHKFAGFSEYNVRLTAVTDVGCVRDTVKRIYILDYPVATPTSGYFEDFEAGNGTWFKTSLVGTSWILGTPTGETINSAASGSQAWWTGTNPNYDTEYSTYLENEKSEVIGPCLDLTGLLRPMVSLNYWTDAQDGFDGTVIQYSTNGGSSWETIGNADGGGIEWYNSANLNGNPGGQDNFAWSDTVGSWKNARYSLEQIPVNLRGEVIFRIAFGSNDDNLKGRVLNGFAFDDVYIGEKKRNVLVEHFTNYGGAQPATSNADLYFNTLLAAMPMNKSDFFKLEYHIANPGVDSISIYNPAAPAARSLFYGVSQPPAAVMDGILGDYYSTVFNGSPFKITAVELDRRALEDPAFTIELDTLPTANNKIKGQLRIEYADSVQLLANNPVILQIALIDDLVPVAYSPMATSKYVVRKLLLNNEGLTVNQQWQYGSTFTHDFEQNIDVPINESAMHYLVAFVQDKTTRRIHQSLVKPLINKKGVKPVGLSDDPVAAEIRDILIYPNPASNVLYFKLDNSLTKDYTWKLVDQRGVTVLDGNVNRTFDRPQEIDISQVANGIYFMQINAGERPLIYRKIAIMNRN